MIVKPAHVFAGLILIIIGSLIVVYDYPQLEYLKNVEQITESTDTIGLQGRLQIEFTVGITILIAGIILAGYGMLKKIKGSLVK